MIPERHPKEMSNVKVQVNAKFQSSNSNGNEEKQSLNSNLDI
jgi:hypothetical protein